MFVSTFFLLSQFSFFFWPQNKKSYISVLIELQSNPTSFTRPEISRPSEERYGELGKKKNLAKICFWMLGTFQKAFSQAATSQFCPSRSTRPHCSLWRLRRPNLIYWKLPLGKLHILEVAPWKIVTWEVALGYFFWEIT